VPQARRLPRRPGPLAPCRSEWCEALGTPRDDPRPSPRRRPWSAGTISLQDARDRAADLRKAAREGRYPVAAQGATRSTIPTFAEAARIAHEQHREGWANGKHVGQWINTLRDHAFPLIGGKLVSEITSADVLSVLSPIWLAKPETARRVRQRIRLVLERARVAGHRDGVNPADAVGAGLPRQSRKTRHFASVPHTEVPELLRRSRVSSGSGLVRLAFEFLILTAARTGEVIGACWDEVHMDDATWTIPASRMKGHREHRVPLSDRSLEILRLAKALHPKSELIFPGRRARLLSNMALSMFLRRLGRHETVHGFRSSFRDWGAESGFSHEVCEAALAHVVENKVERAYRRTDLFKRRRQMMIAWSAFLITGTNSPPALVGNDRNAKQARSALGLPFNAPVDKFFRDRRRTVMTVRVQI